MGALTINRNKRDAEFLSSSLYGYGYDHLHSSKKLKSSNFMQVKKSSSSVSRLSLYPKQVTPIARQIHAPITVVTTFTSNYKHLDTSVSVMSSFQKNSDNSGNRMGNLLSKYNCTKKAALMTLKHRHVDFEMEDDVVEVVNVNDDEKVNDYNGSGYSGVEEVVIVEDEKEVEKIREMYRELDENAEGKLGFQTSTSSGVVTDLVNGMSLENLSLNSRTDVNDGLLYHQKLLNESAKKRDPTLKRLGFDIELLEKKRAVFEILRPAKKEEDVLIEPFRQLTDDDRELVHNAFSNPSRKVLVTHENSNITITGEIIRCLRPGAWLNDEVINVYLELLKEREKKEPQKFLKCHFFNTFFYKKLISGRGGYDYKSVRRWTSQRKLGYSLLDCDKIFVPVHKEIHWCLAVINKKDEKFQYLDSLGGIDKQVMRVLAKYIVDEVKDKNGVDIDASSWKQEYVTDLPNQKNGYDCGVFMIKYADFYSRGIGLCFKQDHMPYFRLRTAKELLQLRAD